MSLRVDLTKYEKYVEEDMPESQPQINLYDYLKGVLELLYILKGWFVTGNLAIYPAVHTYPFRNLAPDLALFKEVVLSPAEQAVLSSWQMREPNRPAPTVVFEFSSKETWKIDLDPKPEYYRLLGVKEYFAYDPQRLWVGASTQLRGWRYVGGILEEIQPDPLAPKRGWLWSVELDSWLGADGSYLRLYDRQGRLRLTKSEADDVQKQIQEQRADMEQQRANLEQQRAETERAAKDIALQQVETERQRTEAERVAKETALQQIELERQRALEAQQQVEAERQRAVEAQQRAEAERQRAVEAQQRAEAERLAKEAAVEQTETLLEKLRKAGIDVDNLG